MKGMFSRSKPPVVVDLAIDSFTHKYSQILHQNKFISVLVDSGYFSV
jgi:hypothetical protein